MESIYPTHCSTCNQPFAPEGMNGELCCGDSIQSIGGIDTTPACFCDFCCPQHGEKAKREDDLIAEYEAGILQLERESLERYWAEME